MEMKNLPRKAEIENIPARDSDKSDFIKYPEDAFARRPENIVRNLDDALRIVDATEKAVVALDISDVYPNMKKYLIIFH